ncbi:MAG: cobalamin B12-binding domain-containing protein [Deltaproteobacteria bacterium]|jgi:methylmalonyl-CoA mutase C-terminal domain/subunit|nr:cobalamin B12-binding domain-containing protein [Deltaproteobacteria bacterium]
MQKHKTRVLIAKVGLDSHDRGAKIVARTLRDAGLEVIYTGIRQSVDQVIRAAVQEDVDLLGLSFLAGDHLVLVPKVIQGLKEIGREDISVLVGGVILKRHVQELIEMGVKKVFLPGTPQAEIVSYIQEKISPPS